jgi:CheY-like chemotaxis protein
MLNLNWFANKNSQAFRRSEAHRRSRDSAHSGHGSPSRFHHSRHSGAIPFEAPASEPYAATPWQELLPRFGEEIAGPLLDALHDLEAAPDEASLAVVRDRIEQARHLAKALQGLASERPARERRPEPVAVHSVVQAVLGARQDWLTRRQVAIYYTPSSVMVMSEAPLLYSLIDEVLLWACSLSHDVAIVAGATEDEPVLRVYARLAQAGQSEPSWQTANWYIAQHQARQTGCRLRYHADEQKIGLILQFPAHAIHMAPQPLEASVDADAAGEVLGGRTVLIVTADATLRQDIIECLQGHGLLVRHFDSMRDACEHAAAYPPNAVIAGAMSGGADLWQLREVMRGHPAAFIEIHPGHDEFHAVQLGATSTGCVGRAVLRQALVPGLVFELCKLG